MSEIYVHSCRNCGEDFNYTKKSVAFSDTSLPFIACTHCFHKIVNFDYVLAEVPPKKAEITQDEYVETIYLALILLIDDLNELMERETSIRDLHKKDLEKAEKLQKRLFKELLEDNE